MRDVIDGLKNHSTREAKDFVVSRIVEEAQREGTPLSEVERKIQDKGRSHQQPSILDGNAEPTNLSRVQPSLRTKLWWRLKGTATYVQETATQVCRLYSEPHDP